MISKLKFIEDFFSKFEGKITKDEDSCTIISKNKIGSPSRTVTCVVSVRYIENASLEKKYLVSGYEKTYSILGGFGAYFGIADILDYLSSKMRNYNFELKGENK